MDYRVRLVSRAREGEGERQNKAKAVRTEGRKRWVEDDKRIRDAEELGNVTAGSLCTRAKPLARALKRKNSRQW